MNPLLLAVLLSSTAFAQTRFELHLPEGTKATQYKCTSTDLPQAKAWIRYLLFTETRESKTVSQFVSAHKNAYVFSFETAEKISDKETRYTYLPFIRWERQDKSAPWKNSVDDSLIEAVEYKEEGRLIEVDRYKTDRGVQEYWMEVTENKLDGSTSIKVSRQIDAKTRKPSDNNIQTCLITKKN